MQKPVRTKSDQLIQTMEIDSVAGKPVEQKKNEKQNN